MTDKWRPIPNYPGYEASVLGEIRGPKSRIAGHTLKARHHKNGYLMVCVYRHQEKKKTLPVARLVAVTHIPNPLRLPEVNHIDGNKHNNKVSNLEWSTRSQNMKHAHRIGLASNLKGTAHRCARLTDDIVRKIRKDRKDGMRLRILSSKYGVSMNAISRVARTLTWKHLI